MVVLLVDLFTEDARRVGCRRRSPASACWAPPIPLLTLAVDGTDRVLFGGAYVVDDFALVLKALFLVAGYVVVLLSTNYIAEGDYWEGEYYLLLAGVGPGHDGHGLGPRPHHASSSPSSCSPSPPTCSPPGASATLTGNEAGMKYYLMGVFASAVMLYGMSLIYGVTGTTLLAGIGAEHRRRPSSDQPVVTLGIVFVIVGFGFKVSAVPFHTWAPDTYEGAPTPVTAFLAVASKAAGFVALLQLIFVAFYGRDDVYEPLCGCWPRVTMTVGNLIALRQTNVVRMLAYSGIAQAGLHPGPAGRGRRQRRASATRPSRPIVIYLIIYTAMNLGAFAVVIAVARKTRSGEISSLRRAVPVRPGPDRGHDALPVLAGRHPAARRLVRQVRRSSGSLVAAGTTLATCSPCSSA